MSPRQYAATAVLSILVAGRAARALAQAGELVETPSGLFPKSCITQVPNGSVIEYGGP